MKFDELFFRIANAVLFLAASVIIYFALRPFFDWYLSKVPIIGVDFFYSATYASYHLRHFSPFFNSFKDIWFGGYPFFDDFPQLHFYLMVPFVKQLGLVQGIQVYVLTALAALITFSCLVFFKLSKNIGLSLLLSILIFLSPNIYGAAIWGGSLPYFATQASLPLTVFLLVQYLTSGNRKWFYAGVLVSGLSLYGHPMPVVTFIFPAVIFLLCFWRGKEFVYKSSSRLKDLLIFFVFNILISLQIFYRPLMNMFRSILGGNLFAPLDLVKSGPVAGTSSQPSQLAVDISNFYKNQVNLILSNTNPFIFYLLLGGAAFFLIVFAVFKDRFGKAGRILPFALFLLFVTAHIYLNLNGFGFLAQGLYRAFWVFPFAACLLAAALWGEFFDSFEKVVTKIKPRFAKLLFFGLSLVISAVFILVGYKIYVRDLNNLLNVNDTKLEYSSTFPEALSIKVKGTELEELKKNLVPSFLNPNDKNKRLYESEAGVNIWWNALFDMPLARGYLDPPIATSERGGIFWLDIAIANDSLVRDFKIDEEVAYNNALFLIDWNAIYYFEGGRLSSKGSNVGPSSYLVKNNVFDKNEETTTYGAVLKYETQSGKPELRLDLPQTLKYFQVNEKFTSPVLYPTNAPAIVFFGDLSSYEDFLRVIATYNINSRKLIPVFGGKYIDKFSSKDLANFDALIISNYDYKNKGKTFDRLNKYVSGGGKIFIDTGAEVKESNASDLPEIFPMKKSIREEAGQAWGLDISDSNLLIDVDLKKFGPLIYNGLDWKLSFPEGDLREGSKIILKHKGKPVLIQRNIGKGTVVWSGVNLTYHYNQYKVDDEAKLIINILQEFVKIEDDALISGKATWEKPEKVKITTDRRVRGILFKEQGYDGWGARLVSENNKKLPIYLAGPTYPGFIYVPLGNLTKETATVEFKFSGAFNSKIVSIISFLAVLFLLERIIFSGFVISNRFFVVRRGFMKKIMFWWEKEDE